MINLDLSESFSSKWFLDCIVKGDYIYDNEGISIFFYRHEERVMLSFKNKEITATHLSTSLNSGLFIIYET